MWREVKRECMEEKVIGGRYEFRKCLGKGGNGSVFLCYDIKLQKEWAVKEVKEQTMELEVLKTISSNLFPRIVDVVQEENRVYLVMDYVEGVTLKEMMMRRKLTEKEVLPWAIEIAKAMQYLHQMLPQILYMDCKPENIMLTSLGEIRLVDLGSVYICGGQSEQRISGTRFFSPEEQQNLSWKDKKGEDEIGKPDVRNDVYAFGMTLYYLLAGKKKIYRRMERLSIRDANPAVSEGMNAVIARCTQKDPAKRLRSMEEVLYQLTHIKEIGRQEKIKNGFRNLIALFIKMICVAGILIGALLYSRNKEVSFILIALCSAIVFLLLCGKRNFTFYEVKKEVFCTDGKRILLYLMLVFGLLYTMKVSVFAEEHSKETFKMVESGVIKDGGTENILSGTEKVGVEVADDNKLQVIFYDSQGRKLLIKKDAVWKISEDILMSIPIEEVKENEGKITVLYENGENGEIRKYEFFCCRK